MKPARRRLRSVVAEIARVAAPAPTPVLYEVIRHHPDTGRSQLVDWNKTKAEADHIVAIGNSPSGITLATSGKFEPGWRYRTVRSSTPEHGSDATVSGVGRQRPGIPPRALGVIRRVGPSPGGSRGGVPRR